MMKRLLACAVALPMLFVAAAAVVRGSEPPTQSGEALYNRFGCYACHGYVGGGGSAGPALAGRGFDTRHVFDYVRAPKGVMPLYRKSVLSDAELSRIAGFVVGLPGARPAAQIPELARLQARIASPPAPITGPARGDRALAAAKAQFAGQCAGCHGSTGEGGVAPALQGDGKARTVEQIMAVIRNPPAGMPRLTPSPIPDADLPALARHVESLGSPGQ